jgi:cbb3-type cytochrome oxidase subunit 3
MQGFSTEDIVVGVIASIGVIVLIVVFVYVVRQVLRKES